MIRRWHRHTALRRAVTYFVVVLTAQGLAGLWTNTVGAQRDVELVDKVRAAFVIKLTRYMTWEAPPESESDSPIRIGVVSQPAVAEALGALIPDQTFDGRPFELVRVNRLEDALDCHIVYVGERESGAIETHREAMEAAHALTIGEGPEFAQDGGIVRLFERENRLAFEINRAAARRTGVRFSSQLLRLATILESDRFSED